MLPEDLELQVKHYQGSISGPVCVLLESFAKRIKLLESKVNCSTPPTPTPFAPVTLKANKILLKTKGNEPGPAKVDG